MLTNAQKRDYYSAMHDLLANGWTKGKLHDKRTDSFCLVGAMDKVTVNENHSLELQTDVENVILGMRTFASPGLLVVKLSYKYDPEFRGAEMISPDGGRLVVEAWNDSKVRRQGQVLKLIAGLRDKHGALAEKDRVVELETLVEKYRMRIVQLQARIEELEADKIALAEEVRWWNTRRANVTARELVESSAALAQMDSDLNEAMAQLTAARSAG